MRLPRLRRPRAGSPPSLESRRLEAGPASVLVEPVAEVGTGVERVTVALDRADRLLARSVPNV